jgi:hypothetical protein
MAIQVGNKKMSNHAQTVEHETEPTPSLRLTAEEREKLFIALGGRHTEPKRRSYSARVQQIKREIGFKGFGF